MTYRLAAALLALAAPALASAQRAEPASAAKPWVDKTFTTSDGTRLHYVEMGTGTPVILIHGAGGSAVGNWFVNGFAKELARTNRVIGIDMRGHGTSERGPEDGRGKMAGDVLEFMRQQGIARAHIGGFSMGGAVTLSLLASNPEKFITAHFGGSGIGETAAWRDRVPADKTGDAPMETKAREAYYRIQRERLAARGEEIGNARTATGAPPTTGFTMTATDRVRMESERQALLERLDLTRIAIPVLAVNGDYDRPFAKTHRMWRELPNFSNLVLPGYGHLSAVMQGFVPPIYIKTLGDFVRANNPPPAV
ncbi:alpha/beta fold hydrolase [Sphingomonas mucosissima]|uniref:Dihydrolipoyllysine-residue acetyltransferase component of acetoin cleaving system n=1 Tax=Sphingomonas mucosissima TaxID=370959 RepID=A0A245ZE02_9SPHN|nr:alpha/beta hydrolase [Sphingomonas mucosissima]OWK27986.1 dihydrolipoyllysine-residue acetyltransferase component of acetoin cleaving system [Sphingomonas mucosissima]